MTDHELCLLAAKAAGYTVEGEGKLILRTYSTGLTALWCPLTFNAHAFDLMVDCLLDVQIGYSSARASTGILQGRCDTDEPHGTDKHAATRRAVTRAAAAMGGEV